MKKLDTQKIALVSITGLVVLGLLYVTTVSTINEVNKYKRSWKEIQFAKQHPMLVGAIREKYELGLKALDQMAREDVDKMGGVISPVPSK